MDELALAPSERVFLEALNTLGVRYLVIGMSAALLQGARGVTEDVSRASWLASARPIVRRIERRSLPSKRRLPSRASAKTRERKRRAGDVENEWN